MSNNAVPAPSIDRNSFGCPHCGAHATQHWFNTYADSITGEKPTPRIISSEKIDLFELEIAREKDGEERGKMRAAVQHLRKLLNGEPFITKNNNGAYVSRVLENTFISECYTCKQIAIWLRDRLIYPQVISGPSPNVDLSDDVKRDYEEARRILDQSPRAAAALLRLAVEKICIELKAEGKTIDARIASLVSKGLPPQVQQALDAVRVIGNEAVHPGSVDMKDDREMATKLFDLVNFIAEDRISRPKQIAEVYAIIPENKRKAIEKRDAEAGK